MDYFERKWPHGLYTGAEDYQRVLVGTDVKATEDIIIKAGCSQKIPVLITPENIPPFSLVTLDKLDRLRVAVRSQVAQRGLDVSDYLVEQLLRIVKPEDLGPEGIFLRSFPLEAEGKNWSDRDIKICQNTGIFSLASWHHEQNLNRGQSLVSILEGSKPLATISGQKGYDWDYMHHPLDSEGGNDIVGIFARIDDKKQRPKAGDEPIIIREGIKNYRQLIDADAEEIPITDVQDLMICQTTSTINLPGEIHAILSRKVFAGIDIPHLRHQWAGIHINSLFLWGYGRTNWPVRLEIIGKNSGVDQARYVGIYFANG